MSTGQNKSIKIKMTDLMDANQIDSEIAILFKVDRETVWVVRQAFQTHRTLTRAKGQG